MLARGYAATLTYDASGRIDHVSDEAGRRLSYRYDAAGRIATITDPGGRRVAYDYDARGDLVKVTASLLRAGGSPQIVRK